MARKSKNIAVLAVSLAVIGAGAASLTLRDPLAEPDAWTMPADPGPLDGLTFVGMVGPDGEELDVADTFVFENGTFVSRECELRCDYPARPYTAAADGDAWTFESETRCPYKDATIVWRGKVEGDQLSGVATWTIHRWYWSLERDFAFEADLTDTSVSELQAKESS